MGILEKIADIEREIAKTQKNKATEYHLGLLKAKLAKYRVSCHRNFYFILVIFIEKFSEIFSLSSSNQVRKVKRARALMSLNRVMLDVL